MDRRRFLFGLGALVGGLAIEQAVPLGRVWSFPKTIYLAECPPGMLYFMNSMYLGNPRYNFTITNLALPEDEVPNHGRAS